MQPVFKSWLQVEMTCNIANLSFAYQDPDLYYKSYILFGMFIMVASIHKTEPPGDQVLEVLAACCLPQLLGQS